jgi:DNA-binding GntR family transcriptional regulator
MAESARNTTTASESPAEKLSTSQTDAALDTIRSRIIDLTLAPGSRIDEPILLQHFGLGRTPAREAIHRLVAEGFVNILPNRGGTFVRKLDFEEIGEVVVAHQLAETVLGQLCSLTEPTLADDLAEIQAAYRVEVNARRFLNISALNERFHMRMNRSIGNQFIYEFAQSTYRHQRRLLIQIYKLEAAEPELQEAEFVRNLDEHERIIQAIRDKDRDTLVSLLPEHARSTQDRLVHILKSKRLPSFPIDLRPIDLG